MSTSNKVSSRVDGSAMSAEASSGFARLLGLLPGILLLAAVGYGGKFIEQFVAHYGKSHHLVLPNIEYVLWAILIGLVIANTSEFQRSSGAGSLPTSSG